MFSDSDSRTGRSSLRTLNIGAIGAVDTFGSSFIGGGGGSGSIGSSCGVSSIGGGGGSRSAGGSGISGRSGRDRRRGYEEHDFDAIDIVLELGELAAGISGSSRDSITPRGQRDSHRYTVHSDFEEVYETEFSEKKLIEENEQPGSGISITSGEESNNETNCTPDKKSVGGAIERPEATLMGRAGTAKTVVDNRRGGQHKRPISRRIKPHSPDSVPLFLKRSQGGSSRRAPDNPATSNMEFLRGVYAFMQVSRSSGNHVKIDSAVFRLHTNATVILLVTFSIAVTTRQYVGNPIDCVHTRDIPEDVLNTYCWIHSTYTVVDAFMKKQGQEVPFPGVDNSQGRGAVTIKHTKYYQWVAFTLFFQAILFYTPRWLWKSWEGGKINALMMDLDIGICSESEKKQKKKLLLDYLWDNLRYHNWWAYRYYVCEFLSLVNVIGQMFLMNRFFDGEFMTFGLDVIAYMEADQEDRMDPMIYIFPRMTKCTFYKYGVSGEVERHDAICILPLNVVNEKIYIFLWFWFILLSILTALTLIYRIVIIFSPRMRVYLLRLRFRLVRRDAIEIIVRRSKMGDWFLLYMLGENIDSIIFRDIMQDLATRLGHNQHHRVPGLKGEIQDA